MVSMFCVDLGKRCAANAYTKYIYITQNIQKAISSRQSYLKQTCLCVPYAPIFHSQCHRLSTIISIAFIYFHSVRTECNAKHKICMSREVNENLGQLRVFVRLCVYAFIFGLYRSSGIAETLSQHIEMESIAYSTNIHTMNLSRIFSLPW